MNPAYGFVLWVVIGALAGWLGSKVMRTDAQQGTVANVIVGVVGAIVGGVITREIFGDDPYNNGFLTSLGIALFGACVVIGLGKLIVK